MGDPRHFKILQKNLLFAEKLFHGGKGEGRYLQFSSDIPRLSVAVRGTGFRAHVDPAGLTACPDTKTPFGTTHTHTHTA